MIAVRLDKDTEARLTELAKSTKRSKSYYMKEAIRQYLKDRAEYEIAMTRARDHTDKTITEKELRLRLGV